MNEREQDDGTLRDAARQWLDGRLDWSAFVETFRQTLVAPTRHATLDLDRDARCGYSEVVYGEGKSDDDLAAIVEQLCSRVPSVLVTRIGSHQGGLLAGIRSDGVYHPVARTWRWHARRQTDRPLVGRAAVVTAGTSDLAVAEEAAETLRWMDVEVDAIHDIGVAGPHRLAAQVERLRTADVVVVVAGMEGALPSVVGGHVAVPVIAVPTSVGYGAAFGGIAALLGMLNSCAANVTVVNIDAGFKAGYVAGLIAHRTSKRPAGSGSSAEGSQEARHD